jgi:putative ABC transport system substrate-binding protein
VSGIGRREFILLGGSAATAWPFAAGAQQPSMPLIGFLRSSSIERSPQLVAAFLQGLKEVGYLEGQNVTIAYRSAEGQYDRLATLAADLVQRRVDIIVATGGSAPAQAAKAATSAIPIVFTTASDPVRDGLVASLNQRGGNLTGISLLATDIGSKRLGLLHELVPNAATIALLLNPKNPDLGQHAQEVQKAARNLGQHIRVLNAANEDDIDSAFAAMARERPDALLLDPDPFLVSRREQTVTLANLPPDSGSLRLPRIRGGRRPCELRAKPHRALSLSGPLRRSHPQRCQAHRFAGHPVDEVRARDSISEPPSVSGSKSRLRCSPAPTR